MGHEPTPSTSGAAGFPAEALGSRWMSRPRAAQCVRGTDTEPPSQAEGASSRMLVRLPFDFFFLFSFISLLAFMTPSRSSLRCWTSRPASGEVGAFSCQLAALGRNHRSWSFFSDESGPPAAAEAPRGPRRD